MLKTKTALAAALLGAVTFASPAAFAQATEGYNALSTGGEQKNADKRADEQVRRDAPSASGQSNFTAPEPTPSKRADDAEAVYDNAKDKGSSSAAARSQSNFTAPEPTPTKRADDAEAVYDASKSGEAARSGRPNAPTANN